QLGGRATFGGTTDEYGFWHWRYEGGGDLEVLEPAGEDGFLHRFLAQRGPGIHHVTFTVPSLDDACDRARASGYSIVGYDDSEPEWKEAFLRPREAQGIVVQFAETNGAHRPPEAPRGRRSPSSGYGSARARPSGLKPSGDPSSVARGSTIATEHSSTAGRARPCASPSRSTRIATRGRSASSTRAGARSHWPKGRTPCWAPCSDGFRPGRLGGEGGGADERVHRSALSAQGCRANPRRRARVGGRGLPLDGLVPRPLHAR